ncbi:pyruvate dehydrogenase complex dihydrolipoamide acetyltransferase [Spirosoma flavum]|uniref:Acetyltransferase component of pyruvate dehydrogenase complex n=1 Tax=Spirosoma flavum TaxID=2048557 RepID=A0ABW6ACP3_9BACT
MAELIRMPKMSDTMTEGVIAEWHKKVGDKVKSGDVLAEVETDKATMDLEAYDEGTLLYIGVEKGASVPVDGVLAVIGADGEDYKSLLSGSSGGSVEAAAPAVAPAPEPAPAPTNGVSNETATKLPDPKAVSAAPAENVNASIIRMPKMSDTMTEGTIVAWHKKEGDTVKSGDVLAEVETDKATMDLEAYEEGTLLYIGVKEGASVAVDEIIAVVGEKGANFKVLLDGGTAPTLGKEAATGEGGSQTAEQNPQADLPADADTDLSYGGGAGDVVESNGRMKASPLAKRIAEEKGINLAQVHGTGPEGRIVKSDVESFVPGKAAPIAQPAAPAQPATPVQSAPAPAATPAQNAPAPTPAATSVGGDYEDIPLSQMRKTIARRLSESLFTAPHFYLTMEINMDKAMELRGTVNGVSPVKVSFNDFVIKAAALALKQHPNVNSSWLGDKIRKYKYVNIGVAVAVDEGLLVPVIRNADQKTLSTISGEVKDLAGKAKDKKLQPKDWEGSTFSISNLGMFGIDEFTAIINPPDSCIMAIGAIKQTVKFEADAAGVPVAKPTNVMKVTLSCDHRVVDGATGSSFLQTFKQLLEEPFRMLV